MNDETRAALKYFRSNLESGDFVSGREEDAVKALLAHIDGESRRGQQAFKDGVEVGRAEVRREMRKLLGIKEDGNG